MLHSYYQISLVLSTPFYFVVRFTNKQYIFIYTSKATILPSVRESHKLGINHLQNQGWDDLLERLKIQHANMSSTLLPACSGRLCFSSPDLFLQEMFTQELWVSCNLGRPEWLWGERGGSGLWPLGSCCPADSMCCAVGASVSRTPSPEGPELSHIPGALP